jgi:hypothetical protein
MLTRYLRGHRCTTDVILSTEATRKYDDSLVYKYSDKSYTFFKVEEHRLDKGEIDAYEIHQTAGTLSEELIFENVGVFGMGALGDDLLTIPVKELKGKVIRCDRYMMTVPVDVMHESF